MPKPFVEFFAGIGLVYEGLRAAGWSATFANDMDPRKQAIYEQNYGAEHFELGDIHALDAAKVPSSILATASFPCIDLSLAGSRKGLEGEHSGAFWGFFRILNDMNERRPPLVMLENVPGFLTSKGGADFIAVIESLNKLGYVCDAFQVDASNFTPQSRQRVFVVGAQEGLMSPLQLEASTRSVKLRPASLRKLIVQHTELKWGEVALPDLPGRDKDLTDVLEDIPDDSDRWWSAAEVEKLLGQMSPAHRETARQMAANNEWSYGTIYRRIRDKTNRAEMRVDGIAGALRTPRGGSSKQFLLKAGYGRYMARVLTGREYGRLQGVPDSYRLDGISEINRMFGFGDAVCVPAITWIGEHCLNPLAEKYLASIPVGV